MQFLSHQEIALEIAREIIARKGVQDWTDPAELTEISNAANTIAAALYFGQSAMALPDSFLDVVGNPLVFADHAGDFSPANSLEHGTPTDVQLAMASVANTAARQSDKADLGANRAPAYRLIGAVELAATPTAGSLISVYWAESPNATAGTANPGGVSGSDAAYTGYSSNIAASVKQLTLIGDFVVTAQATATVQVATNIGILVPKMRYGSLVVYNNSGAAFHSDDVETHFALVPWLPQIQD